MQPEGRDYDIPDPETFREVDQYRDAFSVNRSQGSETNAWGDEGYTYGNTYIPPTSDEPRREPSSGNAMAHHATEKSGVGRKRVKVVGIVAGCALLLGGIGVGGAIVAPKAITFIAQAAQGEEDVEEEPKGNSRNEPVPVDVSIASLPADGWTRDSLTKIELRENSSPITMTNGMIAAITTDGYLYVVDPTTGESVFGSSVANASGVVTYKTDDDVDAVAWRSGSDMYTWDAERGEQRYSFSEEARLYSSGSSPVVWERGSSIAHILKSTGKQDVSIPDGTVPVGVSGGDKLISASATNPVWITNISSPEDFNVDHITLAAPKEGMQIRKWVGLSNGNIVIIWSSPGEVVASSKVNLTVHSVDDGSVIATQEVTWDSVDEESMVPDQTRTKFAVGHTAFDGESFVSADNPDVRITSFAGDRLYATHGNQVGEVKSGKWTALPEGTTPPLGIGRNGEAIVKVSGTAYALTQEGN